MPTVAGIESDGLVVLAFVKFTPRVANPASADVGWFFDKVCDHTAAAADRVVCPRSSVLHADFKGDAGSPFHHPLGGGKLIFENPVPSAAFAETIVQQAQEGLTNVDKLPPEKRDWAKFLLHWRLWPQRTAEVDGRDLGRQLTRTRPVTSHQAPPGRPSAADRFSKI